ncbi:Uncharacterized protein SCF082_LOCUS49223 [Durusdinium trenchii]|uniref:HEAT repeat domain-containing protein n=1 Tax=Durusdinium trenchii TaxID=1381693 RepID=A0ABP0RZV4_9DINO
MRRIALRADFNPSHPGETAMMFDLSRWLLSAFACLWLSSSIARADEPAWPYQFTVGERITYEVIIEVDTGDAVDTHTARPTLHVAGVQDTTGTLKISDTQVAFRSRTKENTFRRRIRVPRRPPFPTLRGFSEREVTVAADGTFVTEKGDSQLPYALGDVMRLLMPSHPGTGDETWTESAQTSIRITSQWPPRISPFRSNEVERLSATEEETWTVESATEKQVTLKRGYHLETSDQIEGEPRLAMQATGTLQLDPQTGWLIERQDDVKFTVRSENLTVKYPLEIRVRRLTEEERQELLAKKDAAAAARVAPLTDEERTQALVALESDNKTTVQQTLMKLYHKSPEEPDGELAAAIANWMQDDQDFVRMNAAKALVNWGTIEEVPLLIESLEDSFFAVPLAAQEALGRLGDERAVPPLVARVRELRSRAGAVQALKSIGAPAEQGVQQLLDDDEWTVRFEACKLLAEIGTEKSLPLLEDLAESDANGVVKRFAENAVKEIRGR